ncbi:MAG: ABC transporter substrate-binding protein [Thermodesulfovibrionales bacterium]
MVRSGLVLSVAFVALLYATSISAAPPRRIISLAPAITEILFALGLDEQIVAVTKFCDRPVQAESKVKVGGMANPSLEAVVSLRPDIVVMTTDGNPREFEERLRRIGFRTYVFRARKIPELPDAIREMGNALDVRERAENLAGNIESSLERLRERSARPRDASGHRALFIVWPEPLIVAGRGTAADDALSILGWENVAAEANSQYPRYSIEEVIGRSPDVILIGSGRGMRELSQGILEKLSMTKAVRSGRVYYVSDALYRLGPRVIEGIEELASVLAAGGSAGLGE